MTQVKKYLVVKTIEGLNHAVDLMALPGFYTLEAAQDLVLKALTVEPQSKYLIQEIGAA